MDQGNFRIKMQIANLQPRQFPDSQGSIITKYEEHPISAFGPFFLTWCVKECLYLAILKISDLAAWGILTAYRFA